MSDCETRQRGVKAAVVTVRRGDMNNLCAGYGYYNVCTCPAPCGTVSVTVRFITENEEHGKVYIDDVSLRQS